MKNSKQILLQIAGLIKDYNDKIIPEINAKNVSVNYQTIIDRRKLLQLSAKDVADGANINFRTYQRVESGEGSTSFENLVKVLVFLNLEIKDIINFPEKEKTMTIEKLKKDLKELGWRLINEFPDSINFRFKHFHLTLDLKNSKAFCSVDEHYGGGFPYETYGNMDFKSLLVIGSYINDDSYDNIELDLMSIKDILIQEMEKLKWQVSDEGTKLSLEKENIELSIDLKNEYIHSYDTDGYDDEGNPLSESGEIDFDVIAKICDVINQFKPVK